MANKSKQQQAPHRELQAPPAPAHPNPGDAARSALVVTIRFNGEDGARIRRAIRAFHERHQDMNAHQFVRDGARRWAVEILGAVPAPPLVGA